ncbi:hypothetical protein BGZ67_008723, partial [Mortierella alpina]
MCNHHFDAMLGEEGSAHRDVEQHGQPERVLSMEDSFEIPDTRAELDDSKASEHPLEHTPYYSYHAEKALKL